MRFTARKMSAISAMRRPLSVESLSQELAWTEWSWAKLKLAMISSVLISPFIQRIMLRQR